MRVMLATICLNEMEWLPRLVEQHRDWPGLCGWVFVEGADPVFKETNPSLVNSFGLSTDGTTEFLTGRAGSSIVYVPQGICTGGDDNTQHKCVLRNQYLKLASHFKPDIIVVLDADEFYSKADQQGINDVVERYMRPLNSSVDCDSSSTSICAWMFKQRHIWHPPSLDNRMDLLFSQEVVGGYWQVPHTRVWRYIQGMRHVRNHNWPEVGGRYLTDAMSRCDLMPNMPECVHLGYSSSQESRAAKSAYYRARGEGSEGGRLGRKRSMYLDCRNAHLTWKPGQELPHGAKVLPYSGSVPECFRNG